MSTSDKKKREAEFTRKFQQWARKVDMGTFVFEAKHTRGFITFECKELKEHQYYSLLRSNSPSLPFVYKIPDDGQSYKPFDGFAVSNVPAFIVICYPTEFVMIPVRSWPLDKKTLSNDEARKIAERVVPLSELNKV